MTDESPPSEDHVEDPAEAIAEEEASTAGEDKYLTILGSYPSLLSSPSTQAQGEIVHHTVAI